MMSYLLSRDSYQDESWESYWQERLGSKIGKPVLDDKYSAGFDAACAELLPMIEELEKVLIGCQDLVNALVRIIETQDKPSTNSRSGGSREA